MNLQARHTVGLVDSHTKAILIAIMSLALFALTGLSSLKSSRGYQNNDTPCATNPLCEGINLFSTERSLHISAGRIHFGDKVIATTAKTLDIPPSPDLQISSEKFRLFSADVAHPYFTRVPAACLAGGIKNGGPVGFLIDPDSLVVENANGRALVADQDYRLDCRLDAIERLKNCSIAEGETVNLKYKVLRKRIDTLSIDRKGSFKLTTGTLSQFATSPADAPLNALPIAHICATPRKSSLTPASIMPISGVIPSHTTVEDLCRNAMNLSATRSKLARHSKLELLMCGDSVCCGAFSSDQAHSYPSLFKSQLKALTGTQVELTKVSLGGTTSSDLLNSIVAALTEKHPDLIVLEFVNDLSLPAEQLRKNYAQIFAAARASGTEIIVCLPHLPSPLFYGQSWQNIADKPFYHVIPALARRNNCAVADIAYRWLHVGEEGLQPIDLLADQANHPNDYGHRIYAQELIKTVLLNK
ncbi:MAG: SGNH/GDSL hydrolase family protein [Candidatus Obscuribacterales bacterium]|nr:SGNH/GDSL hydrolase family protein [Candidatus Obscuribacterales bacterium]